MDETHDPSRTSWVESANSDATDFPIQNLPFGVFRRYGSSEPGRVGVAIGDMIFDVASALEAGVFTDAAADAAAACTASTLNPLMGLGAGPRSALRLALSRLLRQDSTRIQEIRPLLTPMAGAEMLLPAVIHDYTDFYASIHHARNVGSMFRPDNPLLPNYKYVPVGYHGRSSSIVVSGTPIRRPAGQTKAETETAPSFGPTRLLDYELEVGLFIGVGNGPGRPVPMGKAEAHMFGLCLLNDWSARDIQAWEYQPLGPFLAKNFGTTISPWIVTMEALEPFRVESYRRPEGDPAPLPHLLDRRDQQRGAIDLTLEVFLQTRKMRERKADAIRLSRGTFRDMYWTFAQMVAHHTSNGCNLQPGDLLGSGTVSGEAKDSRGCLLELTWRGKEPVELPGGETRRFLEDGDEVILRGYCESKGYRRIGFGECRGHILPSLK